MATKKKVNKIVTPIDQRETFVSLQKNMADTDSIAMEQKLRTLYRIQQTDTKIDKIYLLRGELPLEVQDLEDEIEGLHTRIANAKAEIKEIEKANTEHKHVIEESKHLIAKYDAQRDNVKNKLYAFAKKFASLGYNLDSVQTTLQRVAQNVTESTGIADPIMDTFEEKISTKIPEDSILYTADDSVFGGNTTATFDDPADTEEVTFEGSLSADGVSRHSDGKQYRNVRAALSENIHHKRGKED